MKSRIMKSRILSWVTAPARFRSLAFVMPPSLIVSLMLVSFVTSASAEGRRLRENDDLVYAVTLSQQFGVLDLATGHFRPIGSGTPDALSNLVWWKGEILLTLVTSGSNTGSLAKINPATGVETVIGPTGLGLNAFDLAEVRGELYATDLSNNIYSVDAETGVATPIAATGIPPDPTIPFTYNSDGTFNVCDESFYGVDGKLYATFDSFAIDPNTLATPVKVEPALYRIDPFTGAATRIASTDLKLSASVELEERFYAFRGVLTGFVNGFPQTYTQIVRLDLKTGKTTWLSNIDPSLGLILGAAPVRHRRCRHHPSDE